MPYAWSHPKPKRVVPFYDLGTLFKDRLQWNNCLSDRHQSCSNGLNSGNWSLITDKLGIEAGPLCCAELAARDRTTVHSASYMSETVKERRKSRRREQRKLMEAEGVTYEAGGF